MELIYTSEFFKKPKLHEPLNNTNMKISAGKKCRTCFLKPFFFAFNRENFFQSFRTKFLSLSYMISLVYKIYNCLSVNRNPELRFVVCTGFTFLHRCYTFCTCVTLELQCSLPIRFELFFHVYYFKRSLNTSRHRIFHQV